jgi:hypothetical protein
VRDTSLVWNYKHADVEFGRLQARDLLQVSHKCDSSNKGVACVCCFWGVLYYNWMLLPLNDGCF